MEFNSGFKGLSYIWILSISHLYPVTGFLLINLLKNKTNLLYTGCFMMFSANTNIYNKKTKGPTLMELFTATGNLEKYFSFLTTRDVRCVYHGWHGTHRYDIQVLATHASTWVHRYSSLWQWSVTLGQRVHVAMVERMPGLWHLSICTGFVNTCLTVFL